MAFVGHAALILATVAATVGLFLVLAGFYQVWRRRIPFADPIRRLRHRIPATPDDARLDGIAQVLQGSVLVLIGLGTFLNGLMASESFDRLLFGVYPVIVLAIGLTGLALAATARMVRSKCRYVSRSSTSSTNQTV